MAAWGYVQRGKIHWLTEERHDDGRPLAYPGTACHIWLARDRFARIEVDGCPVDDPRLCKPCARRWAA